MIILLFNTYISHVRDNEIAFDYSSIISNPAMFVYIRPGCSKSNGHQSCNN